MLNATETSPLPSSKQLHWQRIINEWKQSNETQQSYCYRLGIKIPTFQYWLAKDTSSSTRSKNGFTKLEVQTSTLSRHKESSILIELPSGIKINLPIVIGLIEIKNLLQMLGVIHA